MLPEEKVKLLINKMNSMSSAAIPAKKPIIEMFNLAMDEKMLDYLLKVGTDYHTVDQLQEIYHEMYGGDQEEWNAYWAEILTMSFMHPKNNEERHLYGLSPIYPGWVEFYTSGPVNEKRKAILMKFMEFWAVLKEKNKFPYAFLNDYRATQKIKKGVPPRVSTYVSTGEKKEVTLNKPLESQQEIHPAGDIYKLLEKNKDEIAVMNCFCRSYKKMTSGEDCEQGLPVEGCISLGALAEQVVNNGVARHVPYEEALEMMNEFEKKGCIHTAFHYKNDASNDAIIVCNCCPDCCLLYSGWREGGLSKIHARSFYKPQMINESACVGCNLCGRYCPTEATYYDKTTKKLVFDYAKCVGCGQCVTQCKFNVREMVKDERDVFVKTKKRSQVK
ncbi:MAG: 4Fe-4S dicluster domain-containing protein [Erysipelotrichaceae bacterium]|nr:4Fe-4S dicluster domain-containing protein [Erysipelotrichaceae bacterium]